MTNLRWKERFVLPRYNDPKAIKAGVVNIDLEKCTGCSFCIKACPSKALKLENKKTIMIEKNECVFCGDCVAICPEKAIRLESPYEYTNYYKTIDRGAPCLPRLFDK